ncbi:phage head closure protein [Janthinobacterium lividum]|uniref:phage head closure protein n=1 Tax=Janthinobacterium lividum TaxID=29581 RepID=UPI00068A40FA|nr:phage head closure protein [Janthinobacterium lividum]
MSALKLNKRVFVDRPTVTQGDDGGDIAAWLLVGEVWASIAPVGGREAARAGQIIGSTETRIVIRWSPVMADINATWRIRRGDVIYNISRVVNGNLSNREIELTCESGVNDG